MRIKAFLTTAIIVLAAVSAWADEPSQTDDVPFDLDASPLTIPEPAYPALAGLLGLSGYCEVRLSVTPQGLPTAIQPSCSRPTFCRNAARAIDEVRFSPAERGGERVTRNNIIYPLIFLLEGHDEADVTARPLSDCVNPHMVASGTFTQGPGNEAQVSDTQPLVPPRPVYPL